MANTSTQILGRLLEPDAPPFALLRREREPGVELLLGDLVDVERLADLPLPEREPSHHHHLLALVPFRQVRERGFACHDDGTPLRCLRVTSTVLLDPAEVAECLPEGPIVAGNGRFDPDDEAYAAIVERVVRDEIGHGEGANFVIRRDFSCDLSGPANRTALALFRRLLAAEQGAYWTFVVHAGDRTLVGATPERHVTMQGEQVTMNPISGTYRYPPQGPTVEGLLAFLADRKETDELYMVVDEELKQMSAAGDLGGRVLGPYLKQMGHLAHTEYLLAGRSSLDVGEVLRATMFAATVTGSPVENACRVIADHEATGRGWYAGVLALIGRDARGLPTLDAPILIRTLYLRAEGGAVRATLPVGATIVRHSRPAGEVAETHAKAAALLSALGLAPDDGARGGAAPGGAGPDGAGRPALPDLAADPRVVAALAARNDALARFWLDPQDGAALAPELAGRSALLVDAEDDWTQMLAHMLRRLGLAVTVRRWSEFGPAPTGHDLLVAGPGPGDPRELAQPRMAALHGLLRERLRQRRPLLAVCLSHQILGGLLGFPLVRREEPGQGTQREVDLFGRHERAGFYNSFALRLPARPPSGVEVAQDPVTGEVDALRGPGFASTQFHLESVLTSNGVDLLRQFLGTLMPATPAPAGTA
jgi:2-amino-4-deoxychorismate synthase